MKTCKKCNVQKPEIEFDLLRKHLPYRRTICKMCAKKERQEYYATDEYKKRHREQMAKWRKNNPDKEKAIHDRNRQKDKHIHYARRKEKYWNDEEYRNKVKQRELKYKASGRRSEMHRRRQKEKAEELRLKSKEYKINNPEKVKEYVKKYRKNVWNPLEQKQRDQLDRQYVIAVIKKQMNYKIKTSEIPEELIELKTNLLKLKRQKNGKANSNS